MYYETFARTENKKNKLKINRNGNPFSFWTPVEHFDILRCMHSLGSPLS